jgi:hypothetical protein
MVVGLLFLLAGLFNAILSLRDFRAKGLNITRLKFATYNWAAVIIGAVLILVNLLIRVFFR